jgi:hypothetical protein
LASNAVIVSSSMDGPALTNAVTGSTSMDQLVTTSHQDFAASSINVPVVSKQSAPLSIEAPVLASNAVIASSSMDGIVLTPNAVNGSTSMDQLVITSHQDSSSSSIDVPVVSDHVSSSSSNAAPYIVIHDVPMSIAASQEVYTYNLRSLHRAQQRLCQSRPMSCPPTMILH